MQIAEAVSRKHPDKVCDYISDLAVDTALEIDSGARVAVETMGGHGKVFITGEVSTTDNARFLDLFCERLTKSEITDLCGMQLINGKNLIINLSKQSQEISAKVNREKIGAGDQGFMVGYASPFTKSMLPTAKELANKVIDCFQDVDAKSQVIVRDDLTIQTVISASHLKSEEIMHRVELFQKSLGRIIINNGGDWSISGFEADTGVTGRKIAADLYGSVAPVGGGALSGKDGTKVDRSAAYMARKMACELAKHYKQPVTVTVAYVIGQPEPLVAVADIPTLGVRAELSEEGKARFTPDSMIKELGLDKPFATKATNRQVGGGHAWDEEMDFYAPKIILPKGL